MGLCRVSDLQQMSISESSDLDRMLAWRVFNQALLGYVFVSHAKVASMVLFALWMANCPQLLEQ